MSALTLVIGSKKLSSWSLRPWLFLRHHEVAFDELLIALDRADTQARIADHSPSGRVPVLLHGAQAIWESLAICEYAAETLALPAAWPQDPAARAFARSAAHEMHAGFADLRRELPFDAVRAPAPAPMSPAAQRDIARVLAIWREARGRYGHGGAWLCGRFGIVDAMFAPVALRLAAYAVPLEPDVSAYVRAVIDHPAVQQWIAAAAREVPARRGRAAARHHDAESALERTHRDLAIDDAPIPPPAASPPPPDATQEVAVDDIGEDEMPPRPRRAEAPARKPAAKPAPAAAPGVRSFILPPD